MVVYYFLMGHFRNESLNHPQLYCLQLQVVPNLHIKIISWPHKVIAVSQVGVKLAVECWKLE